MLNKSMYLSRPESKAEQNKKRPKVVTLITMLQIAEVIQNSKNRPDILTF